MPEHYFLTQNMDVGYHGSPLIRKITIAVERGEIVTLIGPNGAGKSTILKSIARQLALIGGSVYLDGQSLWGLHREELAKKMAVVWTDRLRTEMMTCEDVVAMGRYPYTGSLGLLSEKDRTLIKEAMELVQVTEIRDRDFTKISDGQKQRVLLAGAICQEPEIIVLDEPTSYLDIRYKLEFLSMLQKLVKKRKMTVLMSLHELELAEKIADRILCVKGEYIDCFGTPEEVFQPGYIRSLFGISAGSFDERSGAVELEAPKGKAEQFVIAGGGSGRHVYRRLQREGTPFITGILFENDMDYPIAKALAADVVKNRAFAAISDSVLMEAEEKLGECRKVICCRKEFGELERANQALLETAIKTGKEIEYLWQR